MKTMNFQTAIFLVVTGIFLGYILGLWQQIAQKQHRENCPECREVYVEEQER